MYRIGLILGPAVFIGAVVEWILRLTHYAELVEKTLPWTEHMISPTGIWVTMVVGILIFVAAWAERKKETDAERKSTERKSGDRSLNPQIMSSSVGKINQRANPVNTVDASQKVEIHNHPPFVPPIPVLPPQPLVTVSTTHNVQFMGVKKIKTDVAHEIFGASEGFVGVKACFLNRCIPGTKTRDFDYVKTRILLRDASGAELAEITRPKWLAHEADDAVHIEVNQTECILLAVFGSDNEWAVPFISTNPANYWDDGTQRLMVDGRSLPAGELSAEITLVGEDNIGLDPVTTHFFLGPNGEVEIKQQ
jgi:hypothetical protein